MSTSERLLHFLQILRRHRCPVSGQGQGNLCQHPHALSRYRQSQGASINGESAIGYLMKPGFMLPPLMFGSEELDALVLGRPAAENGDPTLTHGAVSAMAKISAALPTRTAPRNEGFRSAHWCRQENA